MGCFRSCKILYMLDLIYKLDSSENSVRNFDKRDILVDKRDALIDKSDILVDKRDTP